ncbi:helix-turn-helix domain-containing protein [Ralstonia pseudosolanacearum]
MKAARKPARVILAENIARQMAASKDLRSQNQLAKKSGIGQTTISKWLRLDMDVWPRLDAIEEVANALGVTVAELLTDQDAPPKGNAAMEAAYSRLCEDVATTRGRDLQIAQGLAELVDELRTRARSSVQNAMSAPNPTPDSEYFLSGGPGQRKATPKKGAV